MLNTANITNGVALFTFDDRNFDGWLDAIPLFAEYDAHASFFVSGEINADAIDAMKALRAAGHTVGLHTLHHADAPEYFENHGGDAYFANEVAPQLDRCRTAGLEVTAFAYPNNKHTAETDAYLGRYFRRFRVGLRDASDDEIFVPVGALSDPVMHGCGVGEYYHTVKEELGERLRRASEGNRCVTFFSHNIAPDAPSIHMPTATLEYCLDECRRLGVRALGFDEV